MEQYVLAIKDKTRAKSLLAYLKSIDFLELNKASEIDIMSAGIKASLTDLKQGRVSTWKNKKITIKDA